MSEPLSKPTPERTREPFRTLLDAAYAQEEAYLETLQSLVALESPTHDKGAANTLADHLENLLQTQNWTTERHAQEAVGDHLVARKNENALGTSTLLLTHYDTVWPVGTLQRMPYRRDGNQVYGPGALDMKAGVATALHAPRLADASGLSLAGSLTLLLTSDEETGSLHSRELIESLAREHDRVFVLEPGRDDGALKIGRKGTGGFMVRLEGRSAHAGNDPERGASALRELAHFLLFVEGFNDLGKGTSVNLTVARGGSVSNVIPEEAFASVDMRVLKEEEGERVARAVFGYAPKDAHVKVTVTGGLNRPPLEPNEANQTLFEKAQALGEAMGLTFEGAVVGGGSDGNFTSALGVPTLDGLGSAGEGPHARHEHIRVRETLERLALLTALLTQAG